MEAIIQKTGKLIFHLNLKIRRLLYTRILRNHTSVVSFILLICLLAVSIGFMGIGVPVFKIFIFSTAIISALFLILVLIGSLAEAKRLQQNTSSFYFHFNRNNVNGISLLNLGFVESDQKNLNLILNNLQPKNKIDFKLVSDNRVAADYKKLFRILHLLIHGGIKDFNKERKEMLFKFIESTFTLNGSKVNRASLSSRFSEWVNESETDFSKNLKPFQKILSL